MFSTYNLNTFGKAVRKIRKQLFLTQEEVAEKTQISRDTLRRIENGTVVPRFETLERLSILYKRDLLEVLRTHRSNDALTYFYDHVDSLIAFYEKEKLQSISKSLNAYVDQQHDALISREELEQYKLFLKAIDYYYSPFQNDIIAVEPLLIRSIKTTIPDFSVKRFETFKYNYMEIRILLLLSLTYAKLGQYTLSNTLLTFLEYRHSRDNILNHKLAITIYANIAYNYHLTDQHEKVILYADKGIALARTHNTFTSLYLLFFRKGIAEHALGTPNYINSLKCSLAILAILDQGNLYDVYQSVLKNKYHLDIHL